MSGTNYIPPPQYIVSETTNGNLITVTPGSVPTLENYDYYNQTVLVQNINQNPIQLVQTYIATITIQ